MTGCSNNASDNIEVYALPNVTFTALPDIVIDAGVQTGLSGGSPTGGVYSGSGVTDNGNGMTYSFDPASAGGGEKTLTYSFTNGNGCSGAASDNVIVTTAIAVTFTAPPDLCLNAGVQTGLGGATPTGGIYSGSGVTDDGNGMTYSFDPAAAGVGLHNLSYAVTDGMGGMGSSSDLVEVLALPVVSFTAPADICLNAGIMGHSALGSPTGGSYSGPGVNDLGSNVFTFDPAVAGVGTHALTYTFTDQTTGCSNSNSDEMEVFAVPAVTFTAPADVCVNAGVQSNLGGGLPTGGSYSGPGVTDDANGMTYSFDPSDAGIGAHPLSYSLPGNNSCTGVASDEVNVNACNGIVTWDGSESSSWSVAGNWDSNAVPTEMDLVIIPDVATNDPIITNGVTGLSKSLSITSNGFLTIENGGILTIESDVDPLSVDASGKLTVESGGQLDANL